MQQGLQVQGAELHELQVQEGRGVQMQHQGRMCLPDGCKMEGCTRRYIGEAINPFDRYHRHLKNAFSDFAKTGKDCNKLEEAIRHSGEDAHKKWFIIILQDIPRGTQEDDESWRQRRRMVEKEWMQRFHTNWPRGFNTI